jgi:two-component system chemotaxis sensor kinase CheA
MPLDDNSLFEAILPTFVEELHEHVDALNRNLLGLEGDIPDDERTELLNALFRTAHTLKGASAMINIGVLESTCHQFEEILTALRKGALDLAPNLLQLLFEMCDGIQEAGSLLSDAAALDDAALHAIIPKLGLVMMDVDWQLYEEVEAGEGDRQPQQSSSLEEEPDCDAEPETAPEDARILVSPELPTQPPRDSSNTLFDPLADILTQTPAADPDRFEVDTTDAEPTPSGHRAAAGPKIPSFRIAADKIDALVAKAGDLLATRDRMDTRAEEMLALREQVAQWRSEWLQTRKTLNGLTTGLRDPVVSKSRDGGAAKFELIFDDFYRRLSELGKHLDSLSTRMASDRSSFRQSVIPMEEDVRSMRMVPFSEACNGFERMVRDVAKLGKKEVNLEIRGTEVELDRTVLESIKDPLRHLVRNAVDHGIESPATRIGHGKPVAATVIVSAELRGPLVEIAVADDGRGINHEAIRAKAEARGMPTPTDPRQLVSLIFEPGFSTAEKVTNISGRGVGLDVVKATIESLHGSIGIDSELGAGTRLSLTLPLTLTTIRVLLLRTAGQLFATLATSVDQLLTIERDEIRLVGGRPMISLDGELVPIASLAETLDLTADGLDNRKDIRTVVITADNHRVAFAVDEFLAEQQVVVKSLGSRLHAVRNVSGASILSGGEIVLILNSSELVRSIHGTAWNEWNTLSVDNEIPQRRILLVDDTPTTRVLQKSILESAGYEVLMAVDGVDAWSTLLAEEIDLVITDVEMPRKDGFALTQDIRVSERYRHLPVVLVTGRGSDNDKQRGADAGANAYIVKSSFDHNVLLATIESLI